MSSVLTKAGVDVSRLPKRKPQMTQERWEDMSYLFHTCGYDFKKFRKKVDELNRFSCVIRICHTCDKVDINIMSHWRECDPVAEQYRRESEEVHWR